jgi:hypothetical protein
LRNRRAIFIPESGVSSTTRGAARHASRRAARRCRVRRARVNSAVGIDCGTPAVDESLGVAKADFRNVTGMIDNADRELTSMAALSVFPGQEELSVATLTPIHEIQGAGHSSGFKDSTVTTPGIATARATNGFCLRDPNGDGDTATSDRIFVVTGAAANLTITEIDKVTSVTLLSTGDVRK